MKYFYLGNFAIKTLPYDIVLYTGENLHCLETSLQIRVVSYKWYPGKAL
jgi:hypothetical protein